MRKIHRVALASFSTILVFAISSEVPAFPKVRNKTPDYPDIAVQTSAIDGCPIYYYKGVKQLVEDSRVETGWKEVNVMHPCGGFDNEPFQTYKVGPNRIATNWKGRVLHVTFHENGIATRDDYDIGLFAK